MSLADEKTTCIQDRLCRYACRANEIIVSNMNYIILILLAFLSIGVSFFLQEICPWGSDLLSNIGTGFFGFIVLYYLIERAKDDMQKRRELPLKRSILFNIAKHFEIILHIYMGLDLRYIFIEEDPDKQFIKEVFDLKQAINHIGFATLPPDFQKKFLELIDTIELPSLLISELPGYLVSEQKLSIANEIKELLEMMKNLEVDLGFIAVENIIKKAKDAITRLEYEQPSADTSARS